MNIGITGSNGFIGRNLADYLISEGFLVTKFSGDKLLKDYVYLDWEDLQNLQSNLANLDVLIHLSWIGSEREFRFNKALQELNVNRTKSLVSVQKDTSIKKIIGIGSQDELPDGLQPWCDTEVFDPKSDYGKAKKESFLLLQENVKNFTWARLFSVYGSGDKRNWILTKAVNAIKSNTQIIFGRCSKPWALTHVSDVARALGIVLKANLLGTLNISNLDSPTLRNHLEYMEDLAGTDLFRFSKEINFEREISRSSGSLEAAGWNPIISRKEGFLELLR
jgi:nucleoside-diphosphate-sugar epimerase